MSPRQVESPARVSALAAAASPLRRTSVRALPLFGEGGVLDDAVTFVKLDCEGAELELLTQFRPGDWRNVRRLAFEWSSLSKQLHANKACALSSSHRLFAASRAR